MSKRLEEAGPPVGCEACSVGPVAIYRPTISDDPSIITCCRKEIVKLPAERTIYRAGEAPDTIYTVYSGWAYRAIELSGTRRQIISFLVPGDTTPMESICFGNAPLPYLVRSLTPVILCKFQLAEMTKILERSEAQWLSTRNALQEYCAAMNRRVADIGRRSATGRLAQMFLELHERLAARKFADKGGFAFPPRQDDIADALGLTSVHVSRILADLRRRGIVDFQRDRFRIADIAALRQIAADE